MEEISRKEKNLKLLKKTYDLIQIKESIQIIKNLHPSFWKSPSFLTWQIVRLNTDYQTFVVNLWGNGDLLGSDVDSLNFFFRDYPPAFQESIDDWDKRFVDDAMRYFERFDVFLSQNYKEYFNSFPEYNRFNLNVA